LQQDTTHANYSSILEITPKYSPSRTESRCAPAGCFTAPHALSLYATAAEEAVLWHAYVEQACSRASTETDTNSGCQRCLHPLSEGYGAGGSAAQPLPPIPKAPQGTQVVCGLTEQAFWLRVTSVLDALLRHNGAAFYGVEPSSRSVCVGKVCRKDDSGIQGEWTWIPEMDVEGLQEAKEEFISKKSVEAEAIGQEDLSAWCMKASDMGSDGGSAADCGVRVAVESDGLHIGLRARAKVEGCVVLVRALRTVGFVLPLMRVVNAGTAEGVQVDEVVPLMSGEHLSWRTVYSSQLGVLRGAGAEE